MTILPKLSALALIVLVFNSCGGEKEVETNETSTAQDAVVKDTTPITVDDTTKFKFDFAIANIPSPANVLQQMTSWGVPYDNTILIDPKKGAKFQDEFRQSVILGMYNIDMAHAMANENGADVLQYMKTLLVMANKLGLTSSLNTMVGKRVESNISNKDSLCGLLDEIFVKSDVYLRTNERVFTATSIFAGSWLESLYLTCEVGSKVSDEKLKAVARKLLWNQRLHLDNLLNLLGDFKDKKECMVIVNALSPIYEEIISAKHPEEMTDAKFKSISSKIIDLRNKVIQ